jgi:signal transduction histidine kinase
VFSVEFARSGQAHRSYPHDELSQAERARFAAMLRRGVTSLHLLLSDLLGLARLEAGQEQREVAPFDAAILLQEICENMRPSAKERGLFLETEGATTLEVEGDRVKTYRIAQKSGDQRTEIHPTRSSPGNLGALRKSGALGASASGPAIAASPAMEQKLSS